MVPVSPRCVHSSMHTSDEQLRACEVEGMNGSKLHMGVNYVTPSNFLTGMLGGKYCLVPMMWMSVRIVEGEESVYMLVNQSLPSSCI
jgi:hypothetical protein